MSGRYFVDAIDPVIIHLGPLALRWYGMAYVAGFVAGYGLITWLGRREGLLARDFDYGRLVSWIACGVIIGGRLGEVLFYRPGYYFEHPLEILAVWNGGMASHGGMIGVLIAVLLFARVTGTSTLVLLDLVAIGATPGLFFGRLANFINSELVGSVTTRPWAVIFPSVDLLPRHPVQLYQAFTEGPLLAVILLCVPYRRLRQGARLGTFMIAYAVLRVITESFREVDPGYLGLTLGWTNGQLLSLVMGGAGALLLLGTLRAAHSS